jgi:hypothetical protein
VKQSEFTKCAMCGEGMMKGNVPAFYRFKIEYLAVNLPAVHRAIGLEMAMGNAALAAVMGPGEDLAKEINSFTGLLCFSCALQSPVAEIHEVQADKRERAEAQTTSKE